MTVRRFALAGMAGVCALAMSACSPTVTEADTETSAAAPASAPPPHPTTTEPPTPSAIELPAGVSGPGCEDYVNKVPSGPGSLTGMAVDPVALAVSNSPQLTTFSGALAGKLNSEVDLAETLNKGEYTVFAPTDDAFGKLSPELIEKFKSEAGQLTSVLNYHVVPGDLDPSAVTGEHKTLQGQSVNVTGSGDSLRVNGSGVICGGIKTANATVYLVDTVLIPPPAAPVPPPTSGSTDTSTADTSTPPTS